MKLVMDERVKHRITGVIVIVSMAIIFLPVMLKKSNQRLEETRHVSLKLPEKPVEPKIAKPSQKEMFHMAKVAHVEVPKVVEISHPSLIAKAEPLSQRPEVMIAKSTTVPVEALAPKRSKIEAKIEKNLAKTIKKDGYAVQLASFANEYNARLLVNRLNKEGFNASYIKFMGKQGQLYKVIVGQAKEKYQAVKLQKRLADNLKLNGFIVKAGVS